jgi:hypothetical protein
MKGWVIVVTFFMIAGEDGRDMWAFIGYPFPDVVSCKSFATMNYELASNIASHEIGRPLDEIEDIYCAPARTLLEMKNGKSI